MHKSLSTMGSEMNQSCSTDNGSLMPAVSLAYCIVSLIPQDPLLHLVVTSTNSFKKPSLSSRKLGRDSCMTLMFLMLPMMKQLTLETVSHRSEETVHLKLSSHSSKVVMDTSTSSKVDERVPSTEDYCQITLIC